ncbi:right-handed parallel beta-helix repeat-containing protein [Candidatus Sumerlaeota bacterium]|nr:right-handed parallel beta-helix repeat-containing protein [Candidatus Sumerlaeota bacterium]
MKLFKYFIILFLTIHPLGMFAASEFIIYVDGENGNDLKSGLSWDQARKTIQPAINAAHLGGVTTKVWVKRGTYCESLIMKSNVYLYGGFAGNERSLSERNLNDNKTIIDPRRAASDKPIHHVLVMDSISNALVDGFVITGGEALGEGPDANGAGILCVQLGDSCSISNCMIIWNKAKNYGGGVYSCPASQPHIENCFITQNFAAWGGGIFCGGTLGSILHACTIKNNSATGDDSKGGGVYSLGKTRFVHCMITSNHASFGGGAYCYQKSTFEKCFIIQNAASYGAGVYSREEADLSGCTFSGNSAFKGGGVLVHGAGAVIRNSIFWKNSGGSIAYSKIPPEVRFSCIDEGFPGMGNISSDPQFIGWSSRTNIYIDSRHTGNGDGSKEKPYSTIGQALESFNFYLSDKSPCLKSAENGANMGADHEAHSWKGNKFITFHLAPGEYDTSKSAFDWNVSLEGAGTDKTILKGGVRGLRSGCFLKNLRIQNSPSTAIIIPENESPHVDHCVITDNKSSEYSGGVFLGNGSSARFDNCLIQSNFSKKRGGGLYCDEETSGTFHNCIFRKNLSGSEAGGVYIAPFSKVCFIECIIEDNMTSHDGGGFYCDKKSAPLFQNCLIRTNASHMGGGGWCEAQSSPGFQKCRFLSNHAAFGSGIYNKSSGAAFDQCLFASNNSWYGGGVYLFTGSECSFQNCEIRYNIASSGAGVYCYRAQPFFENCVIEGNEARKDGGGIFCFDSTPRMNHCNLISNNAASGGAVACRRNGPALSHCIVWDNDGAQIQYDHEPPIVRYSCVQGGWRGVGNISSDPGFVGWGKWKIVFIDASTTTPLEGTNDHPFVDVKNTLALYDSALGKDSPCLTSGENGTCMGCGNVSDKSKGCSSVTFHLARGKYDLSDCRFLKYVSIQGEGMNETILAGSLRGLRSGCSLKHATVTGSRSSGLHIGSHQSPLIEKCCITDNLAGAMNFNGAGIFCGSFSNPAIRDCMISHNRIPESFPGTGGAGIYCDYKSQPSFQRCRIENNTTGGNAAAVYCLEANPVFKGCDFTGNVAAQNGGVLFCDRSAPRFANCLFILNMASFNGGAFYCLNDASPVFQNCVLYGNRAEKDGSAFYLLRAKSSVENSIIWNNPGRMFSLNQSTLSIEYSNVESGFAGKGNRKADPLFVSEGSWLGNPGKSQYQKGDYNLKTLSGNFESNSPCIDAGNPAKEYNDAKTPPGSGESRCDMGAYGGSGNSVWLDSTSDLEKSLGNKE